MRGTVYGEAGRDDQALADFNKAISLDPNYAQAYANRALIYRKTNKLDLALADDDKALTIDANYAPAYVGRGIVYREQGRHSRRSPISTRRSRSSPTTPTPITIAACSIRASSSTNSPSTISRPRSVWKTAENRDRGRARH